MSSSETGDRPRPLLLIGVISLIPIAVLVAAVITVQGTGPREWDFILIDLPFGAAFVAVGCIMTFMLAAGTVAVPQIMQSLPGGTGARWFTQVIYSWFFDGGAWNQGPAYAFALLAFTFYVWTLWRRLRAVESDMQALARRRASAARGVPRSVTACTASSAKKASMVVM